MRGLLRALGPVGLGAEKDRGGAGQKAEEGVLNQWGAGCNANTRIPAQTA